MVWRNRFVNDLVGHIYGWLIFLPYLTRQRNHHLHHAWAGHPAGDPENRRIAQKVASISQKEANRMEFAWRYWIPLLAFNSFLGIWLTPFRERAAGDRSTRTRNEIQFVRIYLAGYFAVAGGAGHTPRLGAALLVFSNLDPAAHHRGVVEPSPSSGLGSVAQGRSAPSVLEAGHCFTQLPPHVPVWSRFVLLNFNLHVAHHAFPAVPWYRLLQVHRILSHHGAAGETSGTELGWSIRKRREPLLPMVSRMAR